MEITTFQKVLIFMVSKNTRTYLKSSEQSLGNEKKKGEEKEKVGTNVHHIVKVSNTENSFFLNYSIFGKSSANHLISAWFPEREMHDFPWFSSDFRKIHDFDFKHFPFLRFPGNARFPWVWRSLYWNHNCLERHEFRDAAPLENHAF